VNEKRDGLRERQRAAAIRRIQEAALDLFDERGFENVTIEEIAEAAEVSPSSVYRYLGTKEGIDLYDEFDFELIDAVETELASHPPVEAVRRALASVMAAFFGRDEELARRKLRYALENPHLHAAMTQQVDQFSQLVADALARAANRDASELEIQVIASTLVWALTTAARIWHAEGYTRPLQPLLDEALAVVERGLRLEQHAPAPKRRSRRAGSAR
jgi:AcrR family transcriptional regulator